MSKLSRIFTYNTVFVISVFIFFSCSLSKPKINYDPKGQYSLGRYIYSINLDDIVDDKVYVHLHCPGLNQQTVAYHFPKTIPGTYKELDYGEMIETIEPRDSKGNILPVEKIDKNTFVINNAIDLTSIHYWVNDSWDHPKAMTRIWPMGGTNIEDSLNFVINASGWFGFFEGLELVPVELTIDYPYEMETFSALPISYKLDQSVTFEARDYHHLVDCPIMISKPDTSSFTINNTKVFIEAYHANGKSGYSEVIKNDIQPTMLAVASFTDILPVDEYHFILYFRDGEAFMEAMRSKDVGIIKKIQTFWRNRSLFGAGALEHGNSSFYVLPDFGDTTFTSMIKRVALHEFMHIFTPLNLHSEHIGNFDYVEPKMSKHLWLYEGVTEYFANLILLQSNLISEREFFGQRMSRKISASSRYPEKKISFTKMSEKVFEKKYGKHYLQVYQRGAIIGLLLDIEIIRLTNGQKTLKDVVIELSNIYGAEKSFNEEYFFDEFTALVHPELRQWFADYVEGTIPLDIEGGLAQIGVIYSKKGKHMVPKRIFRDYGTKSHFLSMGKYQKIKKVGKDDPIGFQVGDSVNTDILDSLLYDNKGYPFPEGTLIKIKLKRDGLSMTLPYKIEYKKRKYKHRLLISKDPSGMQSNLYSIWRARE